MLFICLILLYFWSLLQLYITVTFGRKRRNETTNPEVICDPVIVRVPFQGGRREMEREVNVMMESHVIPSREFTQVPFHGVRRKMEREVNIL